jgi:phage FluMu protein Com
MVKQKEMVIEIVAEKGVETDIRCTNCGKKLQTIEKTSKSAGIIITTKCTRCYKFSRFIIK